MLYSHRSKHCFPWQSCAACPSNPIEAQSEWIRAGRAKLLLWNTSQTPAMRLSCHSGQLFFLLQPFLLSFLLKGPIAFQAGQDWSVDRYSILAATQAVTLIYTSLALHKEVSVSSLLQEIHEVVWYNGLMGIWALHRQEAREKQMCVSNLILSPATQTLCVLFLIDSSLSLGLIFFLIK